MALRVCIAYQLCFCSISV